MELHDAIGIDPDSRSCVACLVQRSGVKPVTRSFSLSPRGRTALAAFIGQTPGALVGIEGRQGQSSPLEAFFEDQGIEYYSLPAVNVDKYRGAMVGSQKNNADDAQAVAQFILDLEAKGKLTSFAPKYEVDVELRVLARERLRLGGDITVLTNRLWKAFKESANDLYLSLCGGDEDSGKTNLHSRRLLTLCQACPNVSRWSTLSEQVILEYSGGKQSRGWQEFLSVVKTPLARPVGVGHQVVIKLTAESLLHRLDQKIELEQALEDLAPQRPLVSTLRDHYNGMGIFTAALITEEMITVARFKNDDHLASYAGLTKRDHSTGTNNNQWQCASCNKRLKTAFISFARSYLIYNRGSHLERYHQHLLKNGMSKMEALKRVSRALARDLFRFIRRLEASQKEGEPVA